MNETYELSVVIPTLEEEGRIGRLLEGLRAQRGVRLEVVVADGGSGDGTPEVARKAGARVVEVGRAGRGVQMNAGAKESEGKWLLFLHADSVPGDPDLVRDALERMRWEEQRGVSERVVGHFSLRFEGKGREERGRFYRLLERKSALNRALTTHGDQGMLMRRETFEAVGGFEEGLGFLEDQRFVAALERMGGRRVTLGGYVRTSTRRFEVEGVRARYATMTLIMMAEAVGLEAFLADEEGVYAPQHRAGRLRFLRLAKTFGEALLAGDRETIRGRIEGLKTLGWHNLWQVPFGIDVWLWPAPHGPTPLTDAWTRCVAGEGSVCREGGAGVECASKSRSPAPLKARRRAATVGYGRCSSETAERKAPTM
ncbi:glycosyltransferase [Lujinxingia vulgaris]|uniref:Glycosyltransferase n=1 Tax=Lujinxingia vulgaris TaxID=2600176 RepID=A0A5C6X9R2_9DELT|nr:TIGR04283 family arsenosugar biosynthesis glycosyltransferase [Lujinxingia vulgaris]TXD34762.1 glycosyltransferase [Lujinxingia vulgaris]